MTELEQYENDRSGWLSVVAPRQAARMSDDTYDDTVMAAVWAAMPRDYQTAVWTHLDKPARERIKALRLRG